ncbi:MULTISPECIES: Tm-1-like ATP-binding domain-containing protein [unclassified Streptomyces]|uniref:Tm-1-like ATP-binding domain-containing protein n=1 Tax=unclassified Streptomyces TaxID=2593676 RepID=UPI001BEAB3BD|nr:MULTISPECIES: Tm-1-like ATP-binding domain-containing protein [unclassified Streptomyces]MBT2405374.1 Tm-1-like ATP-binding domain-containing protein [Streptomyces sp. ISL-21]MBT2454123.1 Tm-1-like ATP-binding domain-containing protein [Streptomyces sp. ISL-86]MBT2612225.1 Tm-1-like ATP-binding domain-containing protein [Streptomyces sp. ISL-87]
MTNVVLVGTLDTKGVEYGWLRERLLRAGVEVVLVDTGIMGEPRMPADVPREAVARAAGTELSELRTAADRGAAVATMAQGAEATLVRLHAEGRLHGALAIGGSGGTSIASRAMRALPLGVPKLMVSSMASGDVSLYVGSSDITMMYSVVDIAGINSISAPVMANAVEAIAGMAKAFARSSLDGRPARLGSGSRPLIAASMAGVTTAGVDAARERLTDLGYEVLVFHVSGTGGRTLETLAGQGIFAGVLDLTLSEIADDLCGGVLTAGPDRLSAAGRAGIPQVVSLGALDMVKFGPLETLPERARYRRVRVHNPSITVVRTTESECAELGRRVAAKLRASTGPTAVCIPLRGLSTLGAPGGPYHDPGADGALFSALRDGLRGSAAQLYDYDTDINDPAFGQAAADRLHAMIGGLRAVA